MTRCSTACQWRRLTSRCSKTRVSFSARSQRQFRSTRTLVRKYIGSVVPFSDNFYATLNSAVFSDGSFCYVPKGVRCPIELMTYFRINALDSASSSGTLIIADEGSYVSYLEGCTAPIRKTNQLHAAVVELVTLDGAEIKYSHPPELVSRRQGGERWRVQLRHQARRLSRQGLQDKLDAGRDRFGDHLEVPQRNPPGRQFSRRVLLCRAGQQLPAGGHRHEDDPHGKNTKSTIVAKGISAGHAQNTYRGMVRIMPSAAGARNFTQCDSLLIGSECGAHTVPYIEVRNPTAQMGHEATTSKINDDQLFYLQQRGIDQEEANYMIVNGFCRGIFKELPFEFAAEASQLLRVSLGRGGWVKFGRARVNHDAQVIRRRRRM